MARCKILSLVRLASFVGVVIFAVGCGESTAPTPPKTFPVKGKVTFLDGKPVTSGTIDFRSKDNNLMVAFGDIQADGSFSLKTANKYDGAVAGDHMVTVTVLLSDDVQPIPVDVPLQKTYKVEEKGTNYFPIRIKRPKAP